MWSKNVRAVDENGEPKFSKNGHALYRQFAGDKELIPALREAWADVQNHHLASHGFDIRVDHRSYSEQGIAIQPTMHRGPTAEGWTGKGEVGSHRDQCRDRSDTPPAGDGRSFHHPEADHR
ncbi:MobA/MobL family protein [Ochrobactrum oryzae]|nr:MobA/MobL family protein [Brucella oryzae]